jgi:hypothetical protein
VQVTSVSLGNSTASRSRTRGKIVTVKVGCGHMLVTTALSSPTSSVTVVSFIAKKKPLSIPHSSSP